MSGNQKQEAVLSADDTVSNTGDAEESTTQKLTFAKLTFEKLPYDARCIIWKNLLQDEDRIVPATAILREGSEYIGHKAFDRNWSNECLVDIVPSKSYAAKLAATIFKPDLADPSFLSRILQTTQKEIFTSDNILFIGDFKRIVRPIILEYQERRLLDAVLLSVAKKSVLGPRFLGYDCAAYLELKELRSKIMKFRVGHSMKVRRLALYAFQDEGFQAYEKHGEILSLRSILEELIEDFESLEVLFLVLDTRTNSKTTIPKNSGFFVKPLSGFGQAASAGGTSQDNTKDQRRNSDTVVKYQQAHHLKNVIQKAFNRSNSRTSEGQGLGVKKIRNLEVRIVKWGTSKRT